MKQLLLISFFVFSFGFLSAQEFTSSRSAYESEKITLSEIYPNPAKTTAYLDYSLNDTEAQAQLSLYNVLGKRLESRRLNPSVNRLSIDLSGLTNGVYLYSIEIDSKTLYTKRLIIKH